MVLIHLRGGSPRPCFLTPQSPSDWLRAWARPEPGPLTWRKVCCCRVLAACRTDVACSVSCSKVSR